MPIAQGNKKYVEADARAVEGALDKFSTTFGDIFTVERVSQVDVSSNYPLSKERNIWTTTNNASVTSTNEDSEVHLHTDALAGESARLETAELGRYVSGYAAEAGIGVRMENRPTGDQECRWGYYDENNGFYFGEDANGVFVGAKTSEGSDPIKIYQENWNVDHLDGSKDKSNPSELTFDTTDGHIYRIEFTWYGYGSIEFQIMLEGEDNNQVVVPVHRVRFFGRTSIQDPNLPVTADIDNGTTANDVDLFVGGRQFSIYGDDTTALRIKSDKVLTKSLSGTTWVPILGMRRKVARDGTKINFLGFDVITNADIVVQLRQAPTVSSATWQTPDQTDPNETAMETSKDIAADVNTGRKEFEKLASGASGSNTSTVSQEDIEVRVNRTAPVVMFARTINSQGGTVSVVSRWQEEW